jgi:hypothetical protein
VDAELKTFLEAMESRLMKQSDQVETRLLSEFWKWARSADIKLRQHPGSISAMDERLIAVEERLSKLERRAPRLTPVLFINQRSCRRAW